MAAPALQRRIGRVGANMALLLAAISIALLLGEVLVRVAAPQQLILLDRRIWGPDDGLGHVLRPNLNTTINCGEGEVHLATDAWGHRVNQDPATRPQQDADMTILALGDSFIQAIQVENRDTMLEVLRRRLAAATGRTVRVMNTGVGGYGPNHYLILARRELARSRCDLGLVFLYVGNDWVPRVIEHMSPGSPRTSFPLRWPRSLSKDELIDAVFYPINDHLEKRSHLFVLLKTRGKVLLARLGLTPYYLPEIFIKDENDRQRWEATATVCRMIAEEFARHDAPVLFVLLPTDYQVSLEDWEHHLEMFGVDPATTDIEQPNRTLGALLREASLEVIDVLASLRQARAAGIPIAGSIDTHFNAAGHEVVATALEPRVLSLFGARAMQRPAAPAP